MQISRRRIRTTLGAGQFSVGFVLAIVALMAMAAGCDNTELLGLLDEVSGENVVRESLPSDAEAAAPVVNEESYVTLVNEPLSISASEGILVNDLYVTAIVSYTAQTEKYGFVQVYTDGSFDYTPPPWFEGVDSFDYTVANDLGYATGRVELNVQSL